MLARLESELRADREAEGRKTRINGVVAILCGELSRTGTIREAAFRWGLRKRILSSEKLEKRRSSEDQGP